MKFIADITSNQDLEKIYQKYSDIFHLSDIFAWFFRFLGGLILKGVYIMTSGIENIYNKAFAVMGFVNSNSLNPYIKDFRYIGWGLFSILIAWIGFQYIKNGKSDLSTTFKTLLMGIVTMVVLPSCITWSMDLVQSSKTYIENTGSKTDVNNLSFIPIKTNIIDLKQMDASNFKVDPAKLTNKNTFDANYFVNVWSYTTTIQDDDAAKMKNPTVFQKKLIEDTSGGNNAVAVDDLSSHIFASFLNEYYYRYSGHIFLIIIEEVILDFFYILMTLKIMSLVIELGYTKILAPVIALTDDSGARIKTLILSVVGVFASLEFSLMTIPYYALGMTWLSQTLGSLKLNLMQSAIYFILGELAFFFVMFKGFDLVGKITGVRQGYGSELLQAAIGFGAVGAAANKLGHGAIGAGKSLYNKTNPPEQNGGAGQYANPNSPENDPNNSNVSPDYNNDNSIKDRFNANGSTSSNASGADTSSSSNNSTNYDNGNLDSANASTFNNSNTEPSSNANSNVPQTNGSSTSATGSDSSGSSDNGNMDNPNLSQSNASTSVNDSGSNEPTTSSNATGGINSQSEKPLTNNDNPNVQPQNNSGNEPIGNNESNGTQSTTGSNNTGGSNDNGSQTDTNINNPNVSGKESPNNDNSLNNNGSSTLSGSTTSPNNVNTTNPNVSAPNNTTTQSFNNGGDHITVENPNTQGTISGGSIEQPEIPSSPNVNNDSTPTSNPNVEASLEQNKQSRSALDKINKMYYGASVLNRATEKNNDGEFKE